ncbi:MAG: TonB-dependent receptor plug domain-containing protein [Candidatus Glassbacteria bacterium]|nr:TonB-dependent receptor plug domain-containing protein [Candidatus Glassbacteria bacterium]
MTTHPPAKFFYLCVTLLIIVPSLILAQTGAKIEGTVTASATGQPVAGVQVRVEGTKLGNVTTAEGYYFILNAPVGEQAVTFSYTGYQTTTVSGVKLLAGHTATVDAALSAGVFELEGIVVEAGDEPLVPRDNVQTSQRFGRETAGEAPVENLEQLISLQAGVATDPYGQFNIRGSRQGRQAVYIDGMLVRSFNERPYEADNTPLALATNAIEEVSVVTGGFSAEFGQAGGGVINEVTREGGLEHSGNLRFASDAFMPRGHDYGYNRLQASLGGPLSGLGSAGYFLSGELLGRADRSPTGGGFRGIDQRYLGKLNQALTTLGLYDPNSPASKEGGGAIDTDSFREGIQQLDRHSFSNVHWADTDNDGVGDERRWIFGDEFDGADDVPGTADDKREVDRSGAYVNPNPVRLPGNGDDQFSVSGKLTWYQTGQLKWLATAQTSRKQRMAYIHANLFNNPLRSNLSARITTYNATGGFDWIVEQHALRNTNVKLRANYYRNTLTVGTQTAKSLQRGTWGGFSFESMEFIDEKRTTFDDTYRNLSTNGLPGEQTEPTGLSSTRETERGLWPSAVPGANIPFATSITRLPEGRGGYQAQFINSGLLTLLENSYEDRISVKADLESQLGRVFRVKTGVDFKSFHIVERDFSATGGVFQDYYDTRPLMAAAYVQNIVDFGDLVLDYGLRADYLDYNADFPSVIGEMRPGDPTLQPESQLFFSPRLSVAHPVTDRSQIRLSYGHFFQAPAFKDVYAHSNQDFRFNLGGNANNIFGNPYLEMSQSVMFEVGFTTILSETMRLDFVGYHNESKGDLAVRRMTPEELLELGGITGRTGTRSNAILSVYTNRDRMSAKGVEISFARRLGKFWGINAAYTLSFPRATGSDPQEYILTFGRQTFFDPVTGQRGVQPPPRVLTPIDYDRTHELNVQLNFRVPDNLFPSGSRADVLLSDITGYATFTFSSGQPYTSLSQNGHPSSANNNDRGPSYKNVNLRLNKRLPIPYGGMRLSLFGEIYNLFGFTNYNIDYLNPTTGSPDMDAYILTEAFNDRPDFTDAGGNKVDRIALSDQIDNLPGDDAASLVQIQDINGDGFVSKNEITALKLANMLAGLDDPRAYLRPFQLRLGINLDF